LTFEIEVDFKNRKTASFTKRFKLEYVM